jgi:hypothetical protein
VHAPPNFIHAPPALGFLIAEPGLDFIAGSLKESSLLSPAPVPAAVVWLTVFAFIAPLIIRLARAVRIFMTAIIMSAVWFAVISASISLPRLFAIIPSAALAITRPLAAVATVIRLLIAAAVATRIRLLVIIPLVAASSVIIIVVIRHFALLHKG